MVVINCFYLRRKKEEGKRKKEERRRKNRRTGKVDWAEKLSPHIYKPQLSASHICKNTLHYWQELKFLVVHQTSVDQKFPVKGSLCKACSLRHYFGYEKEVDFSSRISHRCFQYGNKLMFYDCIFAKILTIFSYFNGDWVVSRFWRN
ncbi:MAG: hypothetical protein F6K25_21815 [Okeania sp. SIO2G4]|uniref:hypothetical protein n=1 Tax=unclassified Okeania TaxID=2634635 RepID=UPI0013B6AED0|nr:MULTISPECIES: hypothetical protein [unclassified Okeania]NEP03827.1 hypothetical protein [Okeania sp. SIO4D6]NEP75605.1 hypothetical protein [Okeania sp. SIO2G5]NEP95442.1 hypothetical protein [Okeania sp. SIO2F5]NEQ93156.1 hypothetical protein [Okeania sp. SIO2G4]